MRCELQRLVKDDCRLDPSIDLLEKLADERRLTGPGVAHQQEMAVLLLRADRQRASARRRREQIEQRCSIGCDESDPIATLQSIELPTGDQLGPAECLPSANPLRTTAMSVSSGEKRAANHEHRHRDLKRNPGLEACCVCLNLSVERNAGLSGCRASEPYELQLSRSRPDCRL